MRREGNEILFDDEQQRRDFVEAIYCAYCANHTEKLIAAAMKATVKLEYEAKTWWDAADQFCSPGERPVYQFHSNKLVIETCATESVVEKADQTPLGYLKHAKECAVADRDFELADAIRKLMDSNKPAPQQE